MTRNRLLFAVAVGLAFVSALLVSGNAAASDPLPDCSCIIFNFPEPGDRVLGVAEENICYAMECYAEIEIE